MNKTELTARLAKQTGLPLRDAANCVNAIFSTSPREGIIADELTKGQRVQITGFGTFETRKRTMREGRNPQTGAAITIAAATYPAFVSGKSLKDRVRMK